MTQKAGRMVRVSVHTRALLRLLLTSGVGPLTPLGRRRPANFGQAIDWLVRDELERQQVADSSMAMTGS